jgi:hypothetical protein
MESADAARDEAEAAGQELLRGWDSNPQPTD